MILIDLHLQLFYFHFPYKVYINYLQKYTQFNPLNAELNPICHLLALLGSATIVVVSRLRVNVFLKKLNYVGFQ